MYHSRHMPLLLALLITWTGHIYTLDPSCLRLSGSQECQAFQDYAVNMSNAAPWIRNSTSVDDIDKHLRHYVNQQQWWWQGNMSNNNININSSNSLDPSCRPNGAVFTPRYSTSVLCSQMVRTSPGCNNLNSTSQLPSLCNTTCAGFVNSITSCYTTNATLLYQQCPSTSDENTCIHGYDNERVCGRTIDDGGGCAYCQAEPSDPCCTTLYENGTCPPLKSRQLVGTILGSIFGCLILLACIWCWCWWDQRYKQCSLFWPLSTIFFSRRRKHRSSSPSSLQRQCDSLIPRHLPTKNDKSGMNRRTGISTTNSDIKDGKHMDNKINMHNNIDTNTTGMTTTTATTSTTTHDDEAPTTLSYTLAKEHTTGYCFYQAIYVNVPSRPDDIILEKGDVVYLHCYTNEDWGIGYNIATGQQGSFPMICLCSLPLDQVWEWVYAYPIIKHRSVLKHRVTYFICSVQQDDDEAEADDEHDTAAETTRKATIKMKTKRATTAASAATTTTMMMRRHTLTPSSDDEDSPLTPPPPTFLHRALSMKSKSLGRSKRWIGSTSSLQQRQQQQLYYQPLDSTLTL